MINRSNTQKPANLSDNLRRQIRTPGNQRFLRGLPSFQIEQELPHDLIDLLRQIDRAEPEHLEKHRQRVS